ncbi:hypothetical protein P22_2455 [Propionispora sp. 2/2-37]|uniref:restriction endonuclease subunit S n=1 Tax=Propionispora sp. 2/2-37 TaxID=1677858 RepID=UPI0006BB876B|nr:restriction endonuclease subunit S [Propionispora sp. 2/2-37]CUH96365.1 hypothetical protein P22_2455 [Propionispora sp. 2/2-37]
MTNEMKPSGIAWIGDIPASWEVKRLKYLGTARNGLTYAPEDVHDDGVLVLRSSNIQNNALAFDDNVYVQMRIPSELVLQEDDLLICSRNGSRDLIGKCALIDKQMAGNTYGAFMCVFRSKYNKFIHYVMLSHIFSFYLDRYLTSTINQLTNANLNDITIPIPPDMKEQQRIVAFLDDRCSQIDSIVADMERQVEILQKYKKALITETVTKGLDKSVPMKNSGIDWIGEVPKHWDLKKLKLLATFHNGDRGENYPLSTEIVSEGIPFINAGHLTDGRVPLDNMDFITPDKYKFMGGVKLRRNDILYCLRGSIGKNAIVDFDEGTVASSLVAIRCFACVPKYAFYCLNSVLDDEQRFFYDNGTAQPNLAADSLRKFRITYPPIEEQKAIANWLDAKCAETDALIAEKQRSIDTMRQYKKSLIYEYVTGKKRVTH